MQPSTPNDPPSNVNDPDKDATSAEASSPVETPTDEPPAEAPRPEEGETPAGEAVDTSAPPREGEAAQPEAAPGAEPEPELAPESAQKPRADRRVRAFIAVNLPVPTVRRIADEIQAMKRPIADGGTKVAWVPAANLHVTLKFLGDMRIETAQAIKASLARGLAGRTPFELEVRGMGAFPSVTHPRVLWAGLRDQPALVSLQQDVEAWMEELGFPREARAYHPHITVGRITGGKPSQAQGNEAIAATLATRESTVFGGGRVAEVVLYESRTYSKGAEYRAMARVPIGPGL
jgi:2'-5' RNA ligase